MGLARALSQGAAQDFKNIPVAAHLASCFESQRLSALRILGNGTLRPTVFLPISTNFNLPLPVPMEIPNRTACCWCLVLWNETAARGAHARERVTKPPSYGRCRGHQADLEVS